MKTNNPYQEILMGDFGSYGKAHVVVTIEPLELTFTRSKEFPAMLVDQLTTDDGRTVGQRNQDWLHSKLQEWIDEALKMCGPKKEEKK